MSINFANLAAQGRAKSPTQPWAPEEWEAVCALTKERNIARTTAADYVRNGIMTVEAYDQAIEEDFEPMSQDEAAKKAEEDLRARGSEISKKAEEAKSESDAAASGDAPAAPKPKTKGKKK